MSTWEKRQHLSKIEGKVSMRVLLLVFRCYLYGDLEKPIEEVTDKEFLKCFAVGPKTLAEIRSVIPNPAK